MVISRGPRNCPSLEHANGIKSPTILVSRITGVGELMVATSAGSSDGAVTVLSGPPVSHAVRATAMAAAAKGHPIVCIRIVLSRSRVRPMQIGRQHVGRVCPRKLALPGTAITNSDQ